jgi:hypothetical protein
MFLAPAWSHHQGVPLALKVTNRCGDLMDVIMWVCVRQGIAAAETCRSNKLIKKLIVHFVGLLFHIA